MDILTLVEGEIQDGMNTAGIPGPLRLDPGYLIYSHYEASDAAHPLSLYL